MTLTLSSASRALQAAGWDVGELDIHPDDRVHCKAGAHPTNYGSPKFPAMYQVSHPLHDDIYLCRHCVKRLAESLDMDELANIFKRALTDITPPNGLREKAVRA